MVLWSITPPFGGLSSCPGYVTRALLTLPPRYSPPEGNFGARLAWVSHAASVRSEPGSNPSLGYRSNPRPPPAYGQPAHCRPPHRSKPARRSGDPRGSFHERLFHKAVPRRDRPKLKILSFRLERRHEDLEPRHRRDKSRQHPCHRPQRGGSLLPPPAWAMTTRHRSGRILATAALFTCQGAIRGVSSPHAVSIYFHRPHRSRGFAD